MAKHQDVLVRLSQRVSDQPYAGIPMDAVKAAAALEALRAQIDPFGEIRNAACGPYKDLLIMDLRPYEEPRWVCEQAGRSGQLVGDIARAMLESLARVATGTASGPIETLRTGYPVSDRALDGLSVERIAEQRAKAIASLKPLAPFIDPPVDLEAMVPDRAVELREALAAAPAAGDKFRYARRAPAAVAQVATQLFATAKYRGARPTLLGVLARDDDWAVTRAASGVPVRRTHRVQVVVQVLAEAFCRMYEVDVAEAYMGGGRWGRASTAGVETGPRVVTCKR